MQPRRILGDEGKQSGFVYGVMLCLLSLVIFGITQIAPAFSYALFTDTQVRTGVFSAAFIFPKTVKEMEDAAEKAAKEAENRLHEVKGAYKRCEDSDSEAVTNNLRLAAESAVAARQAANSIQSAAVALAAYTDRAQDDLESFKAKLDELRTLPNGDPEQLTSAEAGLRSSERVLSYVRSAYLKVRDLSEHAETLAAEAEGVASEAGKFMVPKGDARFELEGESKGQQITESVTKDSSESTVMDDIYGINRINPN